MSRYPLVLVRASGRALLLLRVDVVHLKFNPEKVQEEVVTSIDKVPPLQWLQLPSRTVPLFELLIMEVTRDRIRTARDKRPRYSGQAAAKFGVDSSLEQYLGTLSKVRTIEGEGRHSFLTFPTL
jgi:hypothetical protein